MSGPLKSPVGRLVDSNQADDRKMISLVKQRPLLFARCNMPIASYYSQVKLLWKEVADEMGCGVAEVRRKWSHIRNSYSRHLRNELSGARTVKGRTVSRWYLADELEFLKQHMATDRRSPAYSWMDRSECSGTAMESVEVKPFLSHSWYLPPQDPMKLEPDHDDSSNSQSHAPDADENSAYFQFFRSIFNDYKELVPKKQRLFRRQCLNYLHDLLDESEQSSSPRVHQHAINLSSSAECSREQSDRGMCIVMKVESCENAST